MGLWAKKLKSLFRQINTWSNKYRGVGKNRTGKNRTTLERTGQDFARWRYWEKSKTDHKTWTVEKSTKVMNLIWKYWHWKKPDSVGKNRTMLERIGQLFWSWLSGSFQPLCISLDLGPFKWRLLYHKYTTFSNWSEYRLYSSERHLFRVGDYHVTWSMAWSM